MSVILDELIHNVKKNQALELGNVVETFRERGFGVVIFMLGFIIFLPTGFIPGLAAICALLIVMVAIQMLIGKHELWLPKRLKRISFHNENLERHLENLRPKAAWLDRHAKERLHFFVSPLFEYIAIISCLIFALATIPLSFVPTLGSASSLPIMIFALALMLRDGLLMLLGLCAVVATTAAIIILL